MDIIEICKLYQKMGWAIQEQLDNILNGKALEDQNPIALRLMRNFLKSAVDYDSELEPLLEAIDDYLQNNVRADHRGGHWL